MADISLNIALNTEGNAPSTIGNIKLQLDDVKKSADKVSDSFSGIKSPLTSITNGAKGLASSIFSLPTLVAGFASAFVGSEVVKAAEEQEDSINRLNVALSAAGNYSEATSQHFQDFASSIQRTTRFSDDQVLSNAGLLESITRLNGDGLEKALSASINLSSAMGIDLETAVRTVGKAAEGNVSSLKKFGIQVKTGATDTETFSNALLVLNAKFGDAAKGDIQTFSGSTTRLKNSFGEVKESIGNLIIQNPTVLSIVNAMDQIFIKLVSTIDKNKDSIIKLSSNAIKGLLEGFAFMTQSISFVVKAFNVATDFGLAFHNAIIEVIKVANGLPIVSTIFSEISRAVAFSAGGILQLADALLSIPGASQAFEAMGTNIEDIRTKIKSLSDATFKFVDSENINEKITGFLESVQSGVDKTQEIKSQALATITTALDGTGKVVGDFAESINTEVGAIPSRTVKNLKKALDESLEKSKPDMSKAFGELFKDSFKNLDTKEISLGLGEIGSSIVGFVKNLDFSQLFERLQDGAQIIGQVVEPAFMKLFNNLGTFASKYSGELALGTASALVQGKKGLTSALSGAASAIGTAFLGPAGAAAGPLLDALMQGPDQVRSMVKEFVKAIPEVIKNISEALPVLVETLITTLADQADEIIQALVLAAPRVIDGLIIALPRVIDSLIANAPDIAIALAMSMPMVAQELVKGLIPGIGGLGGSIGGVGKIFHGDISGAGTDFVGKIAQGAIDMVKKIIDSAASFGSTLVEAIAPLASKFLEAILNFNLNLINGAINFVAKIIEGVIEFDLKLLQVIVDIAQKFISIAINFGSIIYDTLTSAAARFVLIITDGAKLVLTAIKDIFGEIANIFTGVVSALTNLANAISHLVSSFSGQGLAGQLLGGAGGGGGGLNLGQFLASVGTGGVGGAVTSIGSSLGDVFGFAKGGIVPDGYPKDSGLFKLSSKEYVVNDTITPMLQEFLENQKSGRSSGNNEDLLLRIVSLLEKPMTTESKVQFNSDTLADIMITLNRTNRRIA